MATPCCPYCGDNMGTGECYCPGWIEVNRYRSALEKIAASMHKDLHTEIATEALNHE